MASSDSAVTKEQEELDEVDFSSPTASSWKAVARVRDAEHMMGTETLLRLKSSLWYHVGRIVDEETLNLGVNATPQYIGSLTELVWSQIENISQDLESFASHAGRSTITTKDVLLLTRRNEGLKEILEKHVKDMQNKKETEKVRQK